MSDSRDDTQVFLMNPEDRGIIPLDGLHISKSLRKFMRRSNWTVQYNRNFPKVIQLCAESQKGRESTWISEGLESLYVELHKHGHVFSVEIYDDDELVGGLYGVSLGGAFFGESMFSRATNASKIALVGLVRGLIDNGYSLLDTQFLTPHLATLGGVEIPREEYRARLKSALALKAEFPKGLLPVSALLQQV